MEEGKNRGKERGQEGVRKGEGRKHTHNLPEAPSGL